MALAGCGLILEKPVRPDSRHRDFMVLSQCSVTLPLSQLHVIHVTALLFLSDLLKTSIVLEIDNDVTL